VTGNGIKEGVERGRGLVGIGDRCVVEGEENKKKG
jgi:hypothetical protein